MSSPASKTSLIEFPCVFPIKVMGGFVPGFREAMAAIACETDPNFNPNTIEQRPSKAGNYLGLTLMVRVTSQAELDTLYRKLSGHPLVKVVL